MKPIMILGLTLSAFVLVSATNKFRPDGEFVKKNITGSWRFTNYWNPYGDDDEQTPTAEHRNTQYHFDPSGVVTIWSADSTKKGRQKYTWGISTLKNHKGKPFAVIKIVDASIAPNETAKIEASTSGISLIVIQIDRDFLTWIPVKSYGKTTFHDRQNGYKKIEGLQPPE
jgi:hypothetical protein